jgi:hypothetical protein
MTPLVTDNPIGQANDILMAKHMAETLHKAYPGHMWAVSCDGKIGFADVRNMTLSGSHGFRIRLDHTYSASDFDRRVLMAGGEILERYRLARGRASEQQYGDLKQDFAGRFKADT